MSAEDLLRLRENLQALSDDDLRGLVGDAPSQGSWGWSGTADLDGTKVFVKRIPVTDVEVAAWPSTRNHFGLPLDYQYGVGSAGFGAAREAHVHRAVTDWVLEGRTDAFPVLHHARLLPRRGDPWKIPRGRNDYLAMWGGDPAIAAFMDARTAATHDLWLVAEHLPHTLDDWFVDHQDRVDGVLHELFGAAELLREAGVVHFDAHFGNIVVDADGERFCLSDFGLALSAGAELADDERDFVGGHLHYDVGEIIFSLANLLGGMYRRLSDEQQDHALGLCGLTRAVHRHTVGAALMGNARRLADEDVLDLHPAYVAALERFEPVVDHMLGFYSQLSGDLAARSRHDDDELVARLRACGVEL